MLRREPWNALLWSFDTLLQKFVMAESVRIPQSPRRVLVCNNAHLGDLIMATAVLPPLRQLFPSAEIGFLTSSWARPVIDNNPEVRYIHAFDHFLLNRSTVSPLAKLRRHLATAWNTLQQLRALKYDIAIDTYHFIQNVIPLLWLARIPVRIGYTSGGFGSLLTHAYSWTARNRHLFEYHLDLLRPLGLTSDLRAGARPTIGQRRNVERVTLPQDYIVLHPASGAVFREWPLEKWSLLARKLEGEGWRLVFTGRGEREQENVRMIHSMCRASIDLCGLLSWDQFVSVVESARLLVGVESTAGHMAAAVSTPCVVIYSGTTNTSQMCPFGEGVRTITHPMPCAPCFRTRGCSGMECIRNVTVDTVFEACLEAVRRDSPSRRRELTLRSR